MDSQLHSGFPASSFGLTAKLHVFCGDEKGSVWIYHLSNYTTAWSSAKGKHSDKRIPPTQVGLVYPL